MGKESTMSQTAYETIKQDLRRGRYTHYINGRQTAAELGMGFSPVREALQRLTQERLIVKIPNNGYFVNRIGDHEIQKLFQVRECVELFVWQQIFPKLDMEFVQEMEEILLKEKEADAAGDDMLCFDLDTAFHRLALDRYGNRELTALYVNCKERQMICGSDAIRGRRKEAITEHQEIVDALKKGDREKTLRKLREHIRNYTLHLAV